MKKIAILLVVLLLATYAMSFAGQGNGAPTGPHFNLNIIGVPHEKTGDFDSGNRIFVPLMGKARILLTEGDFAVIDGNGTDGSAAFQLPNPDPENDGITTYSVYIRALGKPGKSATITPGASFYDEENNLWIEVHSEVSVEASRSKKAKFTNVSRELLYVYVDLDMDGTLERYPLFSEEMQDYFWDYDNQGLKLLQMRFYEIPTDLNEY